MQEQLPTKEAHRSSIGGIDALRTSAHPCISPGKLVSYQFTTEAERVWAHPESTDSEL